MKTLKEAVTDGDAIVWKITKDHIGAGDEEGTTNSSPDMLVEFADQLIHKFKLYDDDGELYYEGIATNQDSESAFEPLDWAMANDGCTEIKYLNKGKWETL